MIVWLNPAAAAALAAVLLPLVIHCLLRQRARRVVVPSVRFLARSDESSLRLRAPADVLLLAVRAGIVVLAATALMQPLVVSGSRRAAWADRVVRAVIVDTSESVDAPAARAVADIESRAVHAARRFDSPDPADAVENAVAWLNGAAPARRELVFVSDFQLGTLSDAHVGLVPQTIGVRGVKVAGRRADVVPFMAGKVLHGEVKMAQHAELTGPETNVTLVAESEGLEGLDVIAKPQHAAAALIAAVREAGVVAPSTAQPVSVRLRGTGPHGGPEEALSSWVRAASWRLLASAAIAELRPGISQRGGALALDVDVAAESLEAATVVQAALNARRDDLAWKEREPVGIPDRQISAWSRNAPPPDADAWQNAEASDGQWFWLAALVLMGIESILRRGPAARREQEDARAA